MEPMRRNALTGGDKARRRAFEDGAHRRCHGRHDLSPVVEIAAAALPEAGLSRDFKNKEERFVSLTEDDFASLFPLLGAIKRTRKVLVSGVATFSTLKCERCHSNSGAPVKRPTQAVAQRTAMTALQGLLDKNKG